MPIRTWSSWRICCPAATPCSPGGATCAACRPGRNSPPPSSEFQPEIVYYYGHGVGNEDRTRLLFADDAGAAREVPVADLALCLRRMPRPPLMVYVNCCLGDAAGFLGVGRQVGDFVPAVLTNRTVATIQAAQAQAMAFWESVLLRGVPPHLATARLYGRLTDLELSTADVRWLTPVLHCRYSTWRANPPTPPEPPTSRPPLAPENRPGDPVFGGGRNRRPRCCASGSPAAMPSSGMDAR